jgi:hypothetical protein
MPILPKKKKKLSKTTQETVGRRITFRGWPLEKTKDPKARKGCRHDSSRRVTLMVGIVGLPCSNPTTECKYSKKMKSAFQETSVLSSFCLLVKVDKNGRNLCIHHLIKGLKGEGWRKHSQVN